MLFALAGPHRHPLRRLVIVGDRLFRHRNEKIQWRQDGVQVSYRQTIHYVLRLSNDPSFNGRRKASRASTISRSGNAAEIWGDAGRAIGVYWVMAGRGSLVTGGR